MAANIGYAYLQVVPSFKNVQRDLEKGIAGPSEKAGKTAGGKVRGGMFGVLKSAAGPLAAAAGIASIGKGISTAISEAIDARKISNLTDAVLKSTKGAANVSKANIEAMSGSLSRLSAVDDEVIQSSANVLLTFTKVRNEAGRGNKVFNQAAASALDMSAALGTDLKGATLQVGKALNDPIKGVSALSRAGVSFTAQQKEQIKTLVESGNTLGAQKIILSEMKTQFGGAAAAAASPMDKIKVAMGNVVETVGKYLLPIVDKLANWVVANMPRIEAFMVKVFKAIGQWIKGTVVPAIRSMSEWFQRNRETITTVMRVVGQVVGFAFKVIGVAIRDTIRTVSALVAFWTGAWRTAVNVIQTVRERVTAVFTAVREFITGTWARIRDGVSGAVAAVRDKVVGGFTSLKDRAIGIAGRFLAYVISLPGRIVRALGNMGSLLVQAGKDLISGLIRGAVEFIKEIPGKIADAAKGIGSSLINGLSKLNPFGDGPGAGAGGSALARVRSVLPAGAYISSTYRSPAHNARIGGSPTSYHMDRNNPAVDIGGSTSVLDRLYQRLRAMGGWRELLWRVKGHFDHIHAADQGGIFQGPGFVWMGAGQETFASGLAADKVSGLPNGGPHVVDFTITDWQRGIGQMRIEWNSDIDRRDIGLADVLTYGRN